MSRFKLIAAEAWVGKRMPQLIAAVVMPIAIIRVVVLSFCEAEFTENAIAKIYPTKTKNTATLMVIEQRCCHYRS